MSTYYAVAGDSGTTLDADLLGITSIPNGTVIVAHLVDTAPGGSPHTLDVDIVDAATGLVRLTIDTADLVTQGDYLLEWQATFPGGTVLTWPTDGYDLLRVRAQLA